MSRLRALTPYSRGGPGPPTSPALVRRLGRYRRWAVPAPSSAARRPFHWATRPGRLARPPTTPTYEGTIVAAPQTSGTNTDTPDTVDLTREEGRQVAEDAKRQAGAVAGTAQDRASGVADEAMGHARDLAGDAKQQLHDQARQQTDALGGALNTFGGRVHALAEGNAEEAGPVGDYAQRLAGQVEQIAGRVDELGFDGMVNEVQDYARRKPGAFLLGAAAAGLAVSRLARGAQSAQDNGSGMASGAGVGTPPPPPMTDAATPAAGQTDELGRSRR